MKSDQSQNRQSGPKMSARERREQEITQVFTEQYAQIMQWQRMVWLLLRSSGSPTVTVDNSEMSQLWDLRYSPVEGEPTKTRLTAGLLDEATDSQIEILKAMLLGTQNAIQDLRAHETVGLPDHPVGYLMARLMFGPTGIRFDQEQKCWVTISPSQEPPPANV